MVDAISGAVFENRNPSDVNEVIGLFRVCERRKLKQPSLSARSALAWKASLRLERGNIVFEAEVDNDRAQKELAESLSRENGKP